MDINQENIGKIYGIYFWGSLFWIMFGGLITLVGLLIRVIIEDPHLFFQYFGATSGADIPQVINYYSIFASTVANVFLVVLLLYVFRKVLVEDIHKFKKDWWKNLIYIVVGYFLMIGLYWLVTQIYLRGFGINIEEGPVNQQLIEQALASPISWVVIISAVVIAPFLEEMIFRKFLFGLLEEKRKTPKVFAILVSTLLFSLIHVIDFQSFHFIFLYIPLALIISVSYSISNNNIYVPIALHFLNNFLGIIILV